MFSWVGVLNGAGANWVVRETIASSCMFTLFSAVRSLLFEGQRSMVLWRRSPTCTAGLSSSQPVLHGAVTATPWQTSLCPRISIFSLARPERHESLSPLSESMEVPHSTARREPLAHTSRRRLDRIVHERDRSSRAANHMLAEEVCTASYVKLNLSTRQEHGLHHDRSVQRSQWMISAAMYVTFHPS